MRNTAIVVEGDASSFGRIQMQKAHSIQTRNPGISGNSNIHKNVHGFLDKHYRTLYHRFFILTQDVCF